MFELVTQFLLSMIGFLLTVIILVTIHEFGHYWVACRSGVKILRFSIGFGKPLFRWTNQRGTEFVIASIPLGGYVKMLDERIMPVPPELKPFSFNTQSVGKRIAIVGAGPFANFLFAIFAYFVLYVVGIPAIKPILGEIAPHSVAAEAGFQKRDQILSIGGVDTPTWSRAESALLQHYHRSGVLLFKVKRADSLVEAVLSIRLSGETKRTLDFDLLGNLGISRYLPPIPPVVGQILRDSPAEHSGLLPGDEIIAIDTLPITDWTEVVSYVRSRPQKIIQVSLRRSGSTKHLDLIPEEKITLDGKAIGYVGALHRPFSWPEEIKTLEQYSVPSALVEATHKTWEVCSLTLRFLGLTITGELPSKAVGGPISIAKGAAQSLDAGWISFISFLALFSISLGLLNLLPIPMLDGGHLMFYLVEWIFRRPVPEAIQQASMRVGFALLVAITCVALYNDLF